eukprot:GHVP01014785.1.p1 GENE.GHVP01014785.1~~GHVP01014785.1.p1  ORF type:complete len:123 (+),score=19.64 GHVP01014785.1:27-395(+)
MSVGIPVKLLHEGLGHTITMEVKTGETYRGFLANVEDNMNVMIESVSVTDRDGRATNLEQVYIRGSQIRMVIFPDMLRHAPMFKLAQGKTKTRGLGLGGQRRAIAMRTRATTALTTAKMGKA